MPRYIDADDAIYRLNKLSYSDNQPRAIRRAAKYLDEYTNEAPAADVQEVKHGKRIKIYRGNGPLYDEATVCSICGHTVWEHNKYCSYCGAKMDGDKE